MTDFCEKINLLLHWRNVEGYKQHLTYLEHTGIKFYLVYSKLKLVMNEIFPSGTHSYLMIFYI